jgi:hypothetical protein
VPNFAHWYPRLRVLAGRFDYDRRGILDHTHVRFFTRRSFERLVGDRGWAITRRGSTGIPLEVTERGGAPRVAREADGILRQWALRADAAAVRARPTLFAYQFLYELEPAQPTPVASWQSEGSYGMSSASPG